VRENKSSVITEHLGNVEAMIDFYAFAYKGGSPTFDAAPAVLEMLMKECRASLYAAMECVENREDAA
jgi:hypothetical protein